MQFGRFVDPAVEIADDVDLDRVGRPYREVNAVVLDVRAEEPVGVPMAALGDVLEISITDDTHAA